MGRGGREGRGLRRGVVGDLQGMRGRIGGWNSFLFGCYSHTHLLLKRDFVFFLGNVPIHFQDDGLYSTETYKHILWLAWPYRLAIDAESLIYYRVFSTTLSKANSFLSTPSIQVRSFLFNQTLVSVCPRQGSYPGPGMNLMGTAGSGAPYNQSPGNNAGMGTPQGPPYNMPPSGKTWIDQQGIPQQPVVNSLKGVRFNFTLL